MSSSWVPRRYEPSDDSKIDALLKICFPDYPGSGYWSWILKRNPLGFHGIEGDIWVAEARTGNLVGHSCRIRVPMWFYGKPVVGNQIGLLATHPDYRRQGVSESLAWSARDDAQKTGIAITFGFPNRYSFPLSVKRGLVDFGRVNDLHYVVKRADFVNLRHRNPMTRFVISTLLYFAVLGLGGAINGGNLEFELIPGFMEDVGMVWDSLKHAYDLGIARTREYLQWRYDRIWGDYQILSAVRRAETLGYVVLRTASKKDGKTMSICELLSKDDNMQVYQGLLEEVLRRSREEGITYLSASSSCSRGYHTALRRSRFRNLTPIMNVFRTSGDSHLVARFHEEGQRVQPADLKWYHSIGDRDFG
jgi:GNAT superfamily N-acetyltransferase